MATNLEMLRQIQEDAVSTATSVSELLRRCQVFASRVGVPDFGDWVQHELNGYPTDVELPDYRVFDGIARGHFTGPFGSGIQNAVLPAGNLPANLRDWAETAYIRQPIAAIEEIALNPEGPHPEVSWPGDLIARVQTNFYEGMVLGQAWLSLSRSQFVSAVESVRNRILTFALESDRFVAASPEEGDSDIASSLNNVFHTHIYGSVTNLAQGSDHVSQFGGIMPGDIDSLVGELREHGVPDAQLEELRQAVVADGDPEDGKLGPRVAGWIGDTVGNAVRGVGSIAAKTATTVLPELIRRYYGLNP